MFKMLPFFPCIVTYFQFQGHSHTLSSLKPKLNTYISCSVFKAITPTSWKHVQWETLFFADIDIFFSYWGDTANAKFSAKFWWFTAFRKSSHSFHLQEKTMTAGEIKITHRWLHPYQGFPIKTIASTPGHRRGADISVLKYIKSTGYGDIFK